MQQKVRVIDEVGQEVHSKETSRDIFEIDQTFPPGGG